MGRARGRARGRAQAAQQPAPPAQRGPRAPASVVSSGSSSTQSSAPPVGRSTARSQAAISDVSRQIQQLSVQSGNSYIFLPMALSFNRHRVFRFFCELPVIRHSPSS